VTEFVTTKFAKFAEPLIFDAFIFESPYPFPWYASLVIDMTCRSFIMIFPVICPDTYKFPVKVPSTLMMLPAMTFPFVLRTFDAMMTLAGGQHCPVEAAAYDTGPPLAILSHISITRKH
jgi:hypothetical protein